MLYTRRELLRLSSGLALGLLTACETLPEPQPVVDDVQRTFFNFDTVCVAGGMMDAAVLDQVEVASSKYERLFSRTLEGSDVWRINHANGEPTEVAPETAELIERALSYCETSGGLFDITIGCVSELWDFHTGVVPTPEQVERALPHVGWERLRVEGTTVTLQDQGARIDLGGIAKGYVTDKLIDLMRDAGCESAYVNLGGNVAVLGAKADGSPWSIGVRDPKADDSSAVVAKVLSTGGSVVTSGLYERSFEVDGITYSHILDPRTGYPVKGEVLSASIYAEHSIDGDGYTKPLFMYLLEDGLAYLEDHDLDGLIITADSELHMTEGSAFQAI